ncbi:hypothetical protein NDU88_000587 [Pleurodeles waltl]|uniref:Uncharacterized protein n=1 Tax=Pleurodeles waltl TaxID=8319 RepID=A0AAV7URQ9_PLEWA|nr:hypothetical protein NDU88_000587 [Pleurodeles waltl]
MTPRRSRTAGKCSSQRADFTASNTGNYTSQQSVSGTRHVTSRHATLLFRCRTPALCIVLAYTARAGGGDCAFCQAGPY